MPGGATNGQIARALGISSQQTVYMATQDLAERRLIRAAKEGATWVFCALDARANSGVVRASGASVAHAGGLTPATFEILAAQILGEHYRTPLAPGVVAGIRKRFDFVSADAQIVGDAKYYTLVGGERLPPAKFATIAEHVWLLAKTNALEQFLVFGNDREVPLRWLESGNRFSGTYHVGLQQGAIDGRIEGEGRVGFSFAGMDEMDEVYGRGTLEIDGAEARFILEYHQGDTFTFICVRPT